MTTFLAELPYLAVYATVLLALAAVVGLLCHTHPMRDGTPLDRFLSGERREYRDAP